MGRRLRLPQENRGGIMLISVIYKNGKHGLIDSAVINELISKNRLKGFLRSDGWVTVGQDLIRGIGGRYSGPERRKSFSLTGDCQ